MKIPVTAKPFLWGAVAGAVTISVLGFTWFGWVTGGSSAQMAAAAANDAKVAVLAPICAEQFREQPDATSKLAALRTVSSWERGNVVEKSGAAMMPGSKTIDSGVARACADILMTVAKPKT